MSGMILVENDIIKGYGILKKIFTLLSEILQRFHEKGLGITM